MDVHTCKAGVSPQEQAEQFFKTEAKALALCYSFKQYYLPEQPDLQLTAVFLKEGSCLYLLISEKVAEAENNLHGLDGPLSLSALRTLAEILGAAVFDINTPLPLVPIAIAKPWGQEIWFTGIEERGQSGVGDSALSVPLPWLLSLLPQRLLGESTPSLNLLKILDPLPEPVYGDLYFELHEKKREVYVVTGVDKDCWPSGQGAIRFGFSRRVRAEFEADDGFRKAYLLAVDNYWAVRSEIDEIFDACRQKAGLLLDEPVAVRLLKQWQADLPLQLVEREREMRMAMERFTDLKPLCEGDVVEVPCYLPHALQHGVRTIEFQTPVYERKILAFAQKVLTQARWDTVAGVRDMALFPEQEAGFKVLENNETVCREQIVRFEDFKVQRLSLEGGASWLLSPRASYVLLIVVTGEVQVGDKVQAPCLKSEQAVLLPALGSGVHITNMQGSEKSVVLLSEPVI